MCLNICRGGSPLLHLFDFGLDLFVLGDVLQNLAALGFSFLNLRHDFVGLVVIPPCEILEREALCRDVWESCQHLLKLCVGFRGKSCPHLFEGWLWLCLLFLWRKCCLHLFEGWLCFLFLGRKSCHHFFKCRLPVLGFHTISP